MDQIYPIRNHQSESETEEMSNIWWMLNIFYVQCVILSHIFIF